MIPSSFSSFISQLWRHAVGGVFFCGGNVRHVFIFEIVCECRENEDPGRGSLTRQT